MTVDIEGLEKLAREATPGPWAHCLYCRVVTDHPSRPKHGTFGLIAHTHDDRDSEDLIPNSDANAAYIAACHPQAILALIARVRELEAERDTWKWAVDKKDPQIVALTDALQDAEERVREMERWKTEAHVQNLGLKIANEDCDTYQARAERLAGRLREAREFVETDRQTFLESTAVWKLDEAGEACPDPETLDADEKVFLANYDNLLTRIDAALPDKESGRRMIGEGDSHG